MFARRACLFACLALMQIALLGCANADNHRPAFKAIDNQWLSENHSEKNGNGQGKPFDQETLLRMRQKADNFYARADYLSAEPLYKVLVSQSASDGGALELTDLVEILNKQAKIYQLREQYTESDSCYRYAVETLSRRLGARHRQTAIAMYRLGLSRQARGNYGGVEKLFRDSYQILKKEVVKHPADAESLNIIGYLLFLSGKESLARDAFRQAKAAGLLKTGKEKLFAAEAMNWLAGLHMEAGLRELSGGQTEALYKESLEITETILGKDDPRVASALDDLGQFYYDEADAPEKAERCYSRSLSIRKKTLYEYAPEISISKYWLGRCKSSLGKNEEALVLVRDSHKIDERFYPPGSSQLATSDQELASFLQEAGKKEEADFYRARARLIPRAYAYPPKYKLD